MAHRALKSSLLAHCGLFPHARTPRGLTHNKNGDCTSEVSLGNAVTVLIHSFRRSRRQMLLLLFPCACLLSFR